MLECGLVAVEELAVLFGGGVQLGLAQLVSRLGFDSSDRGARVADFAFEAEFAPAGGAPVLRQVVLEAMTVGVACHIAGRDVNHRRADLAAELDHVGDADGVDCQRFFQRRLEVHQAGAVHDRVETAALERLGVVAQQAFVGDVAGDDRDFAFDVGIEAGAKMLAQRCHHR